MAEASMKPVSPQCPNCGGENLYRSDPVPTGPDAHFLPGLGGFLYYGRFILVACADCGLTQFFADPEATGKLPKSDGWSKL
jgi:predicted nucleic-acid-binding Zn-ribbon protein